MIMSKGNIGEVSRQMICARLMLNGIDVYRPMIEDTPIDLLILKSDGRVIKCQCKNIYKIKNNNSHMINLYSVRKNGPNSKAIKHVYTKEEVDFFIGYCFDTDDLYIIPIEDCGGRVALSLWLIGLPLSRNKKRLFNSDPYKNSFELLK